MNVTADLQGFWKPDKTFVLKEIAVLHPGALTPIVFQFAVPCPWRDLPTSYQKKNRWLEQRFHGLRWSAGRLPYDTVRGILTSLFKGATRIYVKGYEKAVWLRQLSGLDIPIVDLSDLGCPSLRKLQSTNTTCAARNVILLAKWLQP